MPPGKHNLHIISIFISSLLNRYYDCILEPIFGICGHSDRGQVENYVSATSEDLRVSDFNFCRIFSRGVILWRFLLCLKRRINVL